MGKAAKEAEDPILVRSASSKCESLVRGKEYMLTHGDLPEELYV